MEDGDSNRVPIVRNRRNKIIMYDFESIIGIACYNNNDIDR